MESDKSPSLSSNSPSLSPSTEPEGETEASKLDTIEKALVDMHNALVRIVAEVQESNANLTRVIADMATISAVQKQQQRQLEALSSPPQRSPFVEGLFT